MIVDTHAHIFSATGPFMSGARYCPNYDAKIEDWTASWPQADVTHGVLVQPSFLGTDNSLMLKVLEQRVQQLRGVVVVDSAVSEAELQGWHRSGVRGVRLNLLGITELSQFGSREWLRVYEWMNALGWHLEVQCEGERLGMLLSVLQDNSVKLVIDHFGLPDPNAGSPCAGARLIIREAQRREVYVKLSGPYRLRGADAGAYATFFHDELGARRLLWGTDWPWTNHESGRSYPECKALLQQWITSPDSLRLILQENPCRLYGFAD